jgi:hypothetical protein
MCEERWGEQREDKDRRTTQHAFCNLAIAGQHKMQISIVAGLTDAQPKYFCSKDLRFL